MTKIKGKLGGFKKSEVDRHLIHIQQVQEAELDELTKKIETCQREKDLLGQELSSVNDRNNDIMSENLLEIALKKVERITEYIDMTANEDVLAIQESSRQKLLALEHSILLLDKDIQEAKRKIENELKNILEIAKREEQKRNNDTGAKEILDNIINSKVYPIADWLKNNKQSNNENEFWEEQSESQSQEKMKQMTSDGTTEVPLFKQTKLGKNNLSDTSNKQPDEDNEPSIISKGLNNFDKENELQDDFWDSSPDWDEESDLSTSEIAVCKDMGDEPITSDFSVSTEQGMVEKTVEQDMVEKAEEQDMVEKAEEQDMVEKAEEQDMVEKTVEQDMVEKAVDQDKVEKSEDFLNNEENLKVESSSDPVSKEDQSSGETEINKQVHTQAGVRQEIDAVRHKYVLGKIAGEDLLDDSGRVIIRKSDKITESVVEIAQREGKLAELIIHMILPGQEE